MMTHDPIRVFNMCRKCPTFSHLVFKVSLHLWNASLNFLLVWSVSDSHVCSFCTEPEASLPNIWGTGSSFHHSRYVYRCLHHCCGCPRRLPLRRGCCPREGLDWCLCLEQCLMQELPSNISNITVCPSHIYHKIMPHSESSSSSSRNCWFHGLWRRFATNNNHKQRTTSKNTEEEPGANE